MMRLINATETTTSKHPSACAVKGRLRTRHSGWAGSEQSWLIATADAAALQQRLFGSQMMTFFSQPRTLHVGILNRIGSRRVMGADTLMSDLVKAVQRHANTYTLSHVDDMGTMSFAQQAMWVHSQDIIFAPHGAQNVNFVWAQQCAAILEIYPKDYYIPGEYLQLVRAVGAIPFAAYEGDHPYEDTQRSSGRERGPRIARAAVIESFDIRAATKALHEMLKSRSSCLKKTFPSPARGVLPK